MECEVKIKKPRDIIPEQILFKKRISVGEEIFEYPIQYMTKGLIIQSPIIYIPYSTYRINNKITFDFYFLNEDVDKDMEELKSFIITIEKMAKKKVQNSNLVRNIKGKNSKKEFISNIKKNKGSCISARQDRMRVNLYDTTNAYNQDGKRISIDNLKYKSYVKLLLSPTKIWIHGNKYGIYWEVMQVKIYSKFVLNSYNFIDEPDFISHSILSKMTSNTSFDSIYSEEDQFNSTSNLTGNFLKKNPYLSKYFDMLKKGVPRGAVKHKQEWY